jgi:hypothetical protein
MLWDTGAAWIASPTSAGVRVNVAYDGWAGPHPSAGGAYDLARSNSSRRVAPWLGRIPRRRWVDTPVARRGFGGVSLQLHQRTADSVAKAGLEIVRGPLFGAALWRCYVLSAAGVQRAEIPAGEGAEEDRGRLRRRSGLRGGYLSGRTLPKGGALLSRASPPR